MIRGTPFYQLAVGFANQHYRILGTDVDGAHDEFVNACNANSVLFDELADSMPVRIAVLSYMDDFNGDNLTLEAKRNYDVDSCPIYNNMLDAIASFLADRPADVKPVRLAVESVFNDGWEWFIQIAFDAIARQVVHETLKKQYMIPDA